MDGNRKLILIISSKSIVYHPSYIYILTESFVTAVYITLRLRLNCVTATVSIIVMLKFKTAHICMQYPLRAS